MELKSWNHCLAFLRKNRRKTQVILTLPSLFCLVFAVVWIFTGNASWEPWTVLTAAIVAIGQIIITVAENSTPKLVRDMDTEEMKSLIVSSQASDWNRIITTVSKSYSYKTDPNLRIVQPYDESGLQNDNFREEWANKFPDPKAKGLFFDIYYGSSVIARVVLVMVDGGRADLPLPYKQEGKWLTDEFTYAIARINDDMSSLEKYIEWAGIGVDSTGSKL